MDKFIKSNILLSSIVLFMFFFMIITLIKPTIIFNKNGTFKNFGLGYKNKTIIPIWLVSIILGILSYFTILFYIAYNS